VRWARSREASIVVKLNEKGVEQMKREREAEGVIMRFGSEKTVKRQMYFVGFECEWVRASAHVNVVRYINIFVMMATERKAPLLIL